MSGLRVGLDIGGTKTHAVAIDADGRVVAFEAPAGTFNLDPSDALNRGNDVFVRNLAGDLTLYTNVSGTNIDLVTANTLQNTAGASLIASGDWRGKAGAYGIQGAASAFVRQIVGSHHGVMGLPLYETVNLLAGAGLRAS